MMRCFAVLVGLAAIGMISLGCGKQSEKQPGGSGAPPQVQSPDQTASPNAPPPPGGNNGDVSPGPMTTSPSAPAADAPAESSSEATSSGSPQTASADDADGEVRPGRVAEALFRAIRSSVPIPGNLGGTSGGAPRDGEEAPRFQP